MSNVESESFDYLEVTARVQSKKLPTPKGNRLLIDRKVDKNYTPLENGDDLLVIKSQEVLTLLPAMSEDWLIKIIRSQNETVRSGTKGKILEKTLQNCEHLEKNMENPIMKNIIENLPKAPKQMLLPENMELEIAQSSSSSNNSDQMELGDESKSSMLPRKSVDFEAISVIEDDSDTIVTGTITDLETETDTDSASTSDATPMPSPPSWTSSAQEEAMSTKKSVETVEVYHSSEITKSTSSKSKSGQESVGGVLAKHSEMKSSSGAASEKSSASKSGQESVGGVLAKHSEMKSSSGAESVRASDMKSSSGAASEKSSLSKSGKESVGGVLAKHSEMKSSSGAESVRASDMKSSSGAASEKSSKSGKESVRVYAELEIAQSSSNNSEQMELGDESKSSMLPRKSSLDTNSNRNRKSTTPMGSDDSWHSSSSGATKRPASKTGVEETVVSTEPERNASSMDTTIKSSSTYTILPTSSVSSASSPSKLLSTSLSSSSRVKEIYHMDISELIIERDIP